MDRHIGFRLRLRRLSLGLSLQDVARALELPDREIERCETGQEHAGAALLYRMAQVLRTHVSCFYEPALYPFRYEDCLALDPPRTGERDACPLPLENAAAGGGTALRDGTVAIRRGMTGRPMQAALARRRPDATETARAEITDAD
jgi:transcriptional regulator with XRE-family HTH domain